MVFPLLSLASNSLFAGVSFKPVKPVVDGHKAVSQPFPTGGRFKRTDGIFSVVGSKTNINATQLKLLKLTMAFPPLFFLDHGQNRSPS